MAVRARRFNLCLAMLAALPTVFVAYPAKGIPPPILIQVGAEFDDFGVPAASAQFYPSSIAVHDGDLVKLDDVRVVLLPLGMSPTEFHDKNRHFGDRFSRLSLDPDEGPSKLKLNLEAIEPTSDCGSLSQPCIWDQNSLISLGDVSAKRFVEVRASVGQILWAVSLFAPEGSLRVEVVDEDVPLPTSQEIDDQRSEALLRDAALAMALHERFSRPTWHRDDHGRKVWDVWGGVDWGPISLFSFYPRHLSIRRGDLVRWHFELENSYHLAVFPFSRGRSIMDKTLEAVCDPDGDAGRESDFKPDLFDSSGEPIFPFCSRGNLEVDLAPIEREQPRGDTIMQSPTDFEYSGLRMAALGDGGFGNESPWLVWFKLSRRATVDRGKIGIPYICTVHGSYMTGKIVVRS